MRLKSSVQSIININERFVFIFIGICTYLSSMWNLLEMIDRNIFSCAFPFFTREIQPNVIITGIGRFKQFLAT